MPRSRGQALVEFAVVIGVVIVLTIGSLQALYAFYTVRQVRAAAEEIADLAAIYGGDADIVRAQIPLILEQHRLHADLAHCEIDPPAAAYLDPLTITLHYDLVVRFYGLFDLPLPAQRVRRLCEGG